MSAPAGRVTRPTSDRVREAIFGVLGSLVAATGIPVEGARVTDLFAGSGALGIEALSRGAARAVFVDQDHQATATIGANLAALGMERVSTVVRGDAMRWLRTARSSDLTFADPPYDFDRWPELLSLLAPITGLAILEMGTSRVLDPGWEVLREKHYGGTVVMVARPARSPEPAHDRKGDA